MLTGKEQQLLEAMEPLASANGVEIVTVEIIGAKKAPVIRVFIDSGSGVSFQELSSAQAWIGELLDDIDPFPGAYTLEVSSPGIDRPLRTIEHFKRALGEEVRIKTQEPICGRSSFKGILASAENGDLKIRLSEGRTGQKSPEDPDIVCIPLASIRKANVIGKVEF